jgi:hypothetical protein
MPCAARIASAAFAHVPQSWEPDSGLERSACEFERNLYEESAMRLILLIILILLVIGALPLWPYSANWGYYPGGGLGLILLIVIILALIGRL